MDATTPYSFQMTRTSYKSQDLIYEESGHRLVVYLEMAAVRKYDWIASDTAMKHWTEPGKKEISDKKRAEIMDRLAVWAAQQKVRIGFGPPLDLEKFLGEKGYSKIKHVKGVTVFGSPPKRGVISSVIGFFRRKKDA